MTIKNHNELVARLATSNIETTDFSYLTALLMEDRTCNSCRYFNKSNGYSEDECMHALNEETICFPNKDFSCNKWEKKDD
ncbi:MAG: hypothetical protein GQ570_11640 [Helicobacteraceae bacterium]|nr:hypothetical protein [Helicobacteraceae bacterium]